MKPTVSLDPQKPVEWNDGINASRAFWIALIFTSVGVSSFGVGIYLAVSYPAWQVYLMLAIATLGALLDILSIVLIRRGQVNTGARILFWSSLFTIPVNGFLFHNVTTYLAPMVLVVGFAIIFLLFPRSQRKLTPIWPLAAVLVMLLVDYLNPSFRYSLGTLPTATFYGPLMLAFLVLGIIFLVIQQRLILAGFLANISMAWKIILMGLVLLVGMLAITLSAYQGAQSLRYQFSNIYDFMLVPITSIEEADTSLTEAQFYIAQILRQDITPNLTQGYIQMIQQDNLSAEAIIARYGTDWVTTTSPDFTQALLKGGHIQLQQQEVTTLASLQAALNEYESALAPLVRSIQAGDINVPSANNALAKLEAAHEQLHQLININQEFADFSNEQARSAFNQAILSGGIALGISMIFGFLISYLIILSITTRLRDLTRSATAMQAGNLDQNVSVTGRDELARLGTTFNSMAAQLRDFIGTLEQRVAARTRDLATVAEVSTATGTILKADLLLQEVVNLTKERFNLYHAHIYLLDERRENLVLAAGAGQAGLQMVAKGHFIPLGREQSLVARAARERAGVTVNDVTQAPDFLPNPLLPNTRSELAVPMIASGNLLGVFDIQSDQVGRFFDTDINIQTTLAAQVATSLQNVRSFEETQAKAELESLVNTISQKIQRSTTVEETLQTAVREIGLAMRATRVKANLQVVEE
jgi:putative methionine-R-sulfoxide reductase with GAF domain